MPATAVWTMATGNGAQALGFDDLGTLAPGNQADLLLIGGDLPTPWAPHSMADQRLLWLNPPDLCGVMCAGRWLFWNGEVVDKDPGAMRHRVAAEAARM
jgi:5-methylthioadenosine/S-adenosylhomocysteine deaminase